MSDSLIQMARSRLYRQGPIFGQARSPESALTRMNAPYSAYLIGDYTGITPPF